MLRPVQLRLPRALDIIVAPINNIKQDRNKSDLPLNSKSGFQVWSSHVISPLEFLFCYAICAPRSKSPPGQSSTTVTHWVLCAMLSSPSSQNLEAGGEAQNPRHRRSSAAKLHSQQAADVRMAAPDTAMNFPGQAAMPCHATATCSSCQVASFGGSQLPIVVH